MSRHRRYFCRSWVHVAAFTLLACPASPARAEAVPPLFQSDQTLFLSLDSVFSSLRGDRKQANSPWRPAVASFLTDTGESRTLPLQVKTRGFSRLRRGSIKCRFLLLMLNFRDSDTAGTPFEGQEEVPLVTHCRNRDLYEQYVLREFLAYRSYNLMTDTSLRVRLARIAYSEAGGTFSTTRYAFFVEHFDSIAKRLGAGTVQADSPGIMEEKDFDLGVFFVFQLLIGNTDFSVRGAHNVLLLESPEGRIIPVPYDLDSSGLVDTKYAIPNPRLQLPSVRTRRYRGFCEPDEVLQQVLDAYRQRQAAFYELYQEQEGLSEYSRKKSVKYLDSFFAIAESPEKTEKMFSRGCW